MPSNLLNADTAFPQFGENSSDGEKIEKITSYLYMLLEQLRYSLANLDKDNFNDTGLQEIANIITKPVYVQLQDDEKNIMALHVTAKGLAASMADAEGNISQLLQTVNGFSLSVTNGESSSTIRLLANGTQISSQNIKFTGMVTFGDLSGSGKTVICGDNIKSGTIEGITFRSVLKANGDVGGEIEFCYINKNYVAGGIRLDDQGAGGDDERKYRMYIYTENVSGVGFAMKIKSASGMSIEAEENIFIRGKTNCTVKAPRIDLIGNVWINDKLYTQSVLEEEV